MLKGLERFAPLTGVLAIVLWIAGVFIMFHNAPGDKAPGAEIAAWFDKETTTILGAMLMIGLGTCAFIWFLASLATRLRAAEGGGRLPSIVMVAGSAAAAVYTLVPAVLSAGALSYDNLDRPLSAQTAETLWVLPNGFFYASEMIAVACLGAAALSMLRSRAFPVWFGIVTGIVAVVLAIAPVGWAAFIFGIPIWTLVTSIWLFVGKGPQPAAAT